MTHLEARTDPDLMARSADELAADLEVLLSHLLGVYAAWKGAVQAFHHKTWMLQLALRHEDLVVERQCLQDLARLQTALPAAEAAYEQHRAQWHRLWSALLRYKMPEPLHEALHAIAAVEGRSPRDQITLFLHEAVAQWHADQRRC
jgi:hypothetical protein